MSAQPAEILKPTRFQCRHIFTDGHRCGSVCLKNENFCYYHHQTRKPVENLAARRQHQANALAADCTFDLPDLDCRIAVQAAIGQIVQRIANNQIDSRRAGLLLYALQISLQALPKEAPPAASDDLIDQTADILVQDPTHGLIAPITDIDDVPLPRGRGKTLEELLMEDWHREPAHSGTIDIQATASSHRPSAPQLSADRPPHPRRRNLKSRMKNSELATRAFDRSPISPTEVPRPKPPKSTPNPPRLNTLPHFRGVGVPTAPTKKPTPKGGSSQYYAGDHLISHTLTRAVPSAQRGLTSVFGMGTGVTLAVNSPANF